MAEGEATGPLHVLLNQFANPLIPLLLVAGVVAFALGKTIDAGVILAVVLLDVAVGFFQEYRAERSMRALAQLLAPRARVVRAGREIEIAARELVPGDLVVLTSGVRVPADLRLVRARELVVDESLLTGESLPVHKTPSPIDEPDLVVGDQANMAFLGSSVIGGRGAGIVVATGSHTVLGQIAGTLRTVAEGEAPLLRQMTGFSRLIAVVVVGLSVLVFGLGVALGESAVDMFMMAVAMAVAAIPEGLPAVVTIALAVGVRRMAGKHAIVRRLPAVETLGSCTVIGSDKTGTLTENAMTLRQLVVAGRSYTISGASYEPVGEFRTDDGAPLNDPLGDPALALALRIGLLASESAVFEQAGTYHVDGDPTEGALIVAAMKAGLEPEREREAAPALAQIPFESERQYMASLHPGETEPVLYVKGAPERIVAASDRALGPTGPEAFDRTRAIETADRLAADGLRVIALAYKALPPGSHDVSAEDAERGLTIVGLAGLIDPPRPEAGAAVAACRQAGIRVVMITGDHRTTALAIGRLLGLIDAAEQVVEGRMLERLSDAEIECTVATARVYARVAPEHKLRIVQALQRRGEIVAVTGDGVNDAPALRAAHVGVAMGRGGTDVAREASDIVLTDDNFATIFAAVREGRVVYDNLRKAVFFLIPTGIGLVLAILGSMALRLPLPFLPAQAIWVNLVTNGLQDVAMAFEPAERDVARRPPRPPTEPLYTRPMIERTLLAGLVMAAGTIGVFALVLGRGDSVDHARSMALTTMVLFQNFHIANARSLTSSVFHTPLFGNRFLFAAVAGALGVHVLALYWSPLQLVLGTTALAAQDWLLVLAVAATVVVAVELDKLVRGPNGSKGAVPVSGSEPHRPASTDC